MDYAEIESLKALTTNLIKQGCRLKIPKYGVDGKLDSIGFKPHPNCNLSQNVDKIEFNILDDYGQVVPFSFCHIAGCKISTQDSKDNELPESISLNILVSTPSQKEEVEKILIDISLDKSR